MTTRIAGLSARIENELASTIFLTSGLVAYASGGEAIEGAQAHRLNRAIQPSGRNTCNVPIALGRGVCSELTQPLSPP